MTPQNRVLPTGEIVSHPARGTLMGNRGILHDSDGRLSQARWRHKTWIACRLDFGARHREIMSPGRYTELFFLDEAVALAAGHRPCAQCRRDHYNRFLAAWHRATWHSPRASELDDTLHMARIVPGTRRHAKLRARLHELPDGAFAAINGVPHLVRCGRILPFSPEGYGAAHTGPKEEVEVLTPRPTVAALAAGYKVGIHPTSRPNLEVSVSSTPRPGWRPS